MRVDLGVILLVKGGFPVPSLVHAGHLRICLCCTAWSGQELHDTTARSHSTRAGRLSPGPERSALVGGV